MYTLVKLDDNMYLKRINFGAYLISRTQDFGFFARIKFREYAVFFLDHFLLFLGIFWANSTFPADLISRKKPKSAKSAKFNPR